MKNRASASAKGIPLGELMKMNPSLPPAVRVFHKTLEKVEEVIAAMNDGCGLAFMSRESKGGVKG